MKVKHFKLLLCLLSLLLCLCLVLVSCDDTDKGDDDGGGKKPSTSTTSDSELGSSGSEDSGNESVDSSSSDDTDSSNDTTDSSNGDTSDSSDDTTDSSNSDTTDSSDDTTDTSNGDTSDSGKDTTDSSNGGTTDSSEPDDEECAHDFKVTSTVDATCAADGKEISTCSKCGATSEKTLNKLNDHSMVYDETEPTCSAPGLVVGTCSVCGHTTETEGKPALGHSAEILITVIVTSPSCTNGGTQKLVCMYCGEDCWMAGFKPEIPALGHTYERGDNLFDEASGVVYVEAGCGIDGYFARTCQDCGYDGDPITREMYKNLEGKPNSGYDASVYDEMAGKAHVFSVFVIQTEPTCTEPVYLVYKCKNCDAQDNQPQGVASGHIYDTSENGVEGTAFVISLLPTCVTEGRKTYLCTVCGVPSDDASLTVAVPMVDHDTSIHTDEYLISVIEATCNEPVYRIYKCNKGDCDVVEPVSEGEALGHKWVRNGEPSCLTEGLTPYKCSRCDDEKVLSDEYSVDDVKHTLGEMISVPTCISDALYSCALCQAEYGPYESDSQYADGFAHGRHNMVYYETVAPTCYAEGYNLYACDGDEKCSFVGKNVDANLPDVPMAEDVTPRVSHSFVIDEGRVTVNSEGNLLCENCSAVYKDVYTEIYTETEKLCRGCDDDPCSCNIVVETVSYTLADAIQLFPNERLTVSSVVWSDGSERELDINGGIIAIVGYEGVSYTVSIYDSEDNQIMNFFETGEYFYIDLHSYDNISSVTVTASSYATVRFCAIVK